MINSPVTDFREITVQDVPANLASYVAVPSSINPSFAKRDALGTLIGSLPARLDWAGNLLRGSHDRAVSERASRLISLATDAEAFLASDNPRDPAGRKLLLSKVVGDMEWAAERLCKTDDRLQRHKANNVLQAARNAIFFLSAMS